MGAVGSWELGAEGWCEGCRDCGAGRLAEVGTRRKGAGGSGTGWVPQAERAEGATGDWRRSLSGARIDYNMCAIRAYVPAWACYVLPSGPRSHRRDVFLLPLSQDVSAGVV